MLQMNREIRSGAHFESRSSQKAMFMAPKVVLRRGGHRIIIHEILGVDVGTGGTRAGLIDAKGRVTASRRWLGCGLTSLKLIDLQ